MIKILLTMLVFLLGAALLASAQKRARKNPELQRIIRKYKILDANAAYVTAKGIPIAKETRFIQPADNVVSDGNSLLQIALIRHGEPDLQKTGKFSYDQASSFLKNYDSVSIVVPDKPFFKIETPEEVALFVSSINRAQATAHYLFGDSTQMTVSADFREFERALGKRRFKIRLPIKLWTTGARIRWLLGMGGADIESFSEAKKRARKAAGLLIDATKKKPKVVLVAHGFLNRYIKEDLQQRGWHVVRDGGHDYFGTTILVKIKKAEEQEATVSSGLDKI